MCSVTAMPADYDLLVAHSPPVFSHSPPSYYSSFNSCRLATSPNPLMVSPKPSPTPLRRANTVPKPSTPLSIPRRPCLVLRHDDSSSSSDENDLPSPTRSKKRVVFADDKGFSLTQVRMMSEPSFMPPSWNSQFLKLVTQGVSAEVAPEPWECSFSQPASDYLEFRRRLDENFVSLENVIVKESLESVVGTVKVKNISFQKEVVIRSSPDGWVTQEDTYCTFVNNTNPSMPGSVKVIYDTFSFKLTLPPRSRKIEFCVCYRCDGQEFWDSNGCKNYVIVKKQPGQLQHSEPMPIPSRRFHDAVYAKVDSWSEFASWNHLTTDGPYW
uniref:Protein phosphatase 1 regulatory subunit n=1 Tax=Graphocephala atropunctata TaxID=36148 RepID=A0A1B6KVR1_9HEMI